MRSFERQVLLKFYVQGHLGMVPVPVDVDMMGISLFLEMLPADLRHTFNGLPVGFLPQKRVEGVFQDIEGSVEYQDGNCNPQNAVDPPGKRIKEYSRKYDHR